MNNRKNFDFDSNKNIINENSISLGLNKRAKDSFQNKGYDDVLKELAKIEPKKAIEIIKSHLQKNPKIELADNKSTRDYLYIEANCINDKIPYTDKDGNARFHKYKLMFSIEIEPYDDETELFLTWCPFVIFDNTWKKLYYDFILPNADVCHTYKWREIYQNTSSLPYEITGPNIVKILKDLDNFISIIDEFAAMMHEFLNNKTGHDIESDAIDRVVLECLEGFYTYDLEFHAEHHGAPVSKNEATDVNCVAPAKILRESRNINCPNVFERLEEAIHNTTDYDVKIVPSRSFGYNGNNTISIVSEKYKIKKDIDMMQVNEWKEVPSVDDMPGTNVSLLEEEVSKVASKFLPTCSGFNKFRKRMSKLGVI